MLPKAAFTSAGPAPGAPPPWAMSGLPPPPPPSALAAPLTRLQAQAQAAARLVDRDDHHRPVGRGADERDHRRSQHRDLRAGCRARACGSRRRRCRREPGGRRRRRRRRSRPPPRSAGRPEQLGRLEPGELPLGVAEPGHDRGDPLGELLRAGLELLAELVHEDRLAGQEPERVDAHQRLDPAHAGADGRLAEQLDQAELARPGHVGAAAELAGVLADLDDPHLGAVLLAEQRQRAHRPRLVDRGVVRADAQVVDQHPVDLVLDLAQDRDRHRARRGEVEPEPAGRVLRARLRGRLAQRAPQGAMDQVGRGVAAGRGPPALDVDFRVGGGAGADLAVADRAPVHHQAGQRGLHVGHLDLGRAAGPAGLDHAVVAELAAALGVERGPVEHDRDLHARGGPVHRYAIGEQADHRRLPLGHVVAGEGDLARLLEQRGVDRDVGVAGLLLPRVLLGPVPLLAHQAAEALLVDLQALLGRHLEGEVDREPVGVVQLERLRAGQHAGVLALGLLDRHIEDRGAGAEGVGEGRVLGVDDPVDVARIAAQLGELVAHRLDGGLGQLVHEPGAGRRAAAPLGAGQQAQVADAAPQQPPEHVAAALVAWPHPVLDQHHRAAHVIGDDPQRHVAALVGAVVLLGKLGRPLEDLVGGVDLVDVVDALQQRRHPLEAHAGVDVLHRQRAVDVEVVLLPDLAQLVLHEHEVPELQVPVLVDLRAALAAVLGAAVVVDLRARAARPGHAHVPVVVGQAAALDPALRHADLVPPDRVGLLVAVQHGRPQPVLGEAEAAVGLGLGDQLPGEPDRAFLEVIAERPVAEHLEERAVPGGLSDLFDVERADALLDVGRALERRRLLAEQVGLERLHAGDDEQQRGIVGDEVGRGHDGVPLRLEVRQETAGDLCRLHQRSSFTRSSLAVCGPSVGLPWARCRTKYRSMPSLTSRLNIRASLVNRIVPRTRPRPAWPVSAAGAGGRPADGGLPGAPVAAVAPVGGPSRGRRCRAGRAGTAWLIAGGRGRWRGGSP